MSLSELALAQTSPLALFVVILASPPLRDPFILLTDQY
jgi:hypothetical protein